jgi:hypothetical protein
MSLPPILCIAAAVCTIWCAALLAVCVLCWCLIFVQVIDWLIRGLGWLAGYIYWCRDWQTGWLTDRQLLLVYWNFYYMSHVYHLILSRSDGRSVKLLLTFASTVIPGFNPLEIHDQYFYSLLDMYVFLNGATSSTREGSVFLRRRYFCCSLVSARVYPRCHGVQVTMHSAHPLSPHCSK